MAFKRLRVNLLRTVARQLTNISHWVQSRAEQENATLNQEAKPSLISNAPAHWLADIDRLKQDPDAFVVTQYTADAEGNLGVLQSEKVQGAAQEAPTMPPKKQIVNSRSPAVPLAVSDADLPIPIANPTTEGSQRGQQPSRITETREARPAAGNSASDGQPVRREAMPLLPAKSDASGRTFVSASEKVRLVRPLLQASDMPEVDAHWISQEQASPPAQGAQPSFQGESPRVTENASQRQSEATPLPAKQRVALQKTVLAAQQPSLVEAVAKPLAEPEPTAPPAMIHEEGHSSWLVKQFLSQDGIQVAMQRDRLPSSEEESDASPEAVHKSPVVKPTTHLSRLADRWPSLPDEADGQQIDLEAARADRLRKRRRRLDQEQRGELWNESLF